MLRGLFSARNVALGIAVVVIATTGSIYAASIPSASSKRLGATGNITVAAPSTNADVTSWVLDSSGNVDSVVVTWTPASSANYSIQALLKNSGGTVIGSGTLAVTSSGTSLRNDSVNITQIDVDPSLVATAVVSIRQTG